MWCDATSHYRVHACGSSSYARTPAVTPWVLMNYAGPRLRRTRTIESDGYRSVHSLADSAVEATPARRTSCTSISGPHTHAKIAGLREEMEAFDWSGNARGSHRTVSLEE